MTGAAIDSAVEPVTDADLGLPEPKFVIGAELETMKFLPIKYVVPGLIVEGLSIIAGKPKIGKSWLCMDMALAVAQGGSALGNIPCQSGGVLYAALEDNLRRLQSRMRRIAPYGDWPKQLTFTTDLPRLDDGCLEILDQWARGASDPRLIIIDTLARVRGARGDRDTQYDGDYQAITGLQQWATRNNIAVVLVHHTRKLEADDAIDKVSGTLGLTGAADSVLVLDRRPNGDVLAGRGRDIEEFEHAMKFDVDLCLWQILGDATEVRRSNERRRICEVLAASSAPMSPTDIAADAGMKVPNVKVLLGKMVKAGEVWRPKHGVYALVDLASSAPAEPEGNRRVTAVSNRSTAEGNHDTADDHHTSGNDYLVTPAGQTTANSLKSNNTSPEKSVTVEGNRKVTGGTCGYPSEPEDNQITEVTGVQGEGR